MWKTTKKTSPLSLALCFTNENPRVRKVISSVQCLSRVWLFAIPWIAAHQASLSIINSQSLLKLMPIESVMPSSHLILCHPLLLLPPIPPSIRVFSNESALRMRWPMYWSFSFSISPSNEYPGLNSFRMDWLDLLVGHNWSEIYELNFLSRVKQPTEETAIWYWRQSEEN